MPQRRETGSQFPPLPQSIAAGEAQRAVPGDAVVATALAPLRQKLAELEAAEGAPGWTLEGERRLVTIPFADILGTPCWKDVVTEAH